MENIKYDKQFYEMCEQGMLNSANAFLSLLFEYYRPSSVLDIGCGQGAWLAVAEKLGAKKLKGFDGSWVDKKKMLSPNIEFSVVNFEDHFPTINEKFDLCICVEVAEHISEEKASSFIDFLSATSSVIIFGAAIKYQGGRSHINEQWQSYWIEKFKKNNFECFDFFRPKFWNNNSIEWWYTQNTFLFVNQNTQHIDIQKIKDISKKPIYDIVHPINYEKKVEYYKKLIANPPFRYCLGHLRNHIVRLLFPNYKR